jgi:hypothetical protein
MNKTSDASLEEVIAPNVKDQFFRYNPVCGKPIVKVRNTGASVINSIEFGLGPLFATPNSYTWTGTLQPREEKTIEMPEQWSLRSATGNNLDFQVTINKVNGAVDIDRYNDNLKVKYNATPVWGVKTRISMKTNNQGGENRWKIYDIFGNVVAQRDGVGVNTTYNDTVVLGPACYRFVMEDDGCDGLYWWANSAQGSGTLTLTNVANGAPLTNQLAGYFNRDFGCGFSQWFRTSWPTGIADAPEPGMVMETFPNPASDAVQITFTGTTRVDGTITVYDALGRMVWSGAVNSNFFRIPVSDWNNGLYTAIYRNAKETALKLQTRFVVAH